MKVATRGTGKTSRKWAHALVALCASCVLITAAACSPGGGGTPSGSPVDHLTVSISNTDYTFAPLFLAQSQGFFAKHGLSVTILDGPIASTISYLVSGKADLTLYSVLPGLLAADQGADIKFVYQNLNVFGLPLIGSKNVATVAQAQRLSSCRFATGPAGTLTYSASNTYMRDLHLRCALVQVPSISLITTGVQAGSYQLGVVSLSPALDAAAAGAHILVDPRSAAYQKNYAQSPYLVETVFGIGSRLPKIRGAVVKFIQALQDVQPLYQTMTPAQLAAALLKNSQFAGQSASSLATGFSELQHEMRQGCQGGAHGQINQACWSATLNALARWGVPTFHAGSAANSYANRVDMSYYDAAQSR